MKKLLLLFLAIVTGMVNANAADDLYLRTDFNGTDLWNSDDASMKFTYEGTNPTNSNEDVYTYVINASDIKKDDVWFRLHISGWGKQICPYTSGSYTFVFKNGQYETYGAKYEKEYFQGSTYSFGIPHSTIKANQYKITVYRGNNYVTYENENCKVMWIKVEIVNMPITIGTSGFATLVSDRALDFTNTGITAYTAEDAGSGNATLISVDKPKAKTPMLLKASEGNYIVPVILNSNPNPEFNEVITAIDNPTNNAFKAGQGAAVASKDGNYKNYILNNGTFYLANDQMVATNKAYLQLSGDGSKANLIFPNGDATSISSIMGEADNTNVYYNLQGMQVSNPTKGMYIVNGKKIMVK